MDTLKVLAAQDRSPNLTPDTTHREGASRGLLTGKAALEGRSLLAGALHGVKDRRVPCAVVSSL